MCFMFYNISVSVQKNENPFHLALIHRYLGSFSSLLPSNFLHLNICTAVFLLNQDKLERYPWLISLTSALRIKHHVLLFLVKKHILNLFTLPYSGYYSPSPQLKGLQLLLIPFRKHDAPWSPCLYLHVFSPGPCFASWTFFQI